MTSPSIYLENVSLSYGDTNIFTNLNLNLPAGKWLALLGRSGVGKSSLLRLLAGLTTAKETTTGRVYTDNHTALSKQITYMAQQDLLLPWLNVLNNATLATKLNSYKLRNEQIEKAKTLLHKVGLGADVMHLFPHQLSGGMRQRLALVRTLLNEKPVVLMDEPFSAVDAITRYKLQALAAVLLRNKTVLFITHDPTEALRLADEIYLMQSDGLQLITKLTSQTPRELSDPLVIKLQSLLFNELSKRDDL